MATPFPFTSGQTLLAAQLNAITTLPTTTKTASHTLVIADQGTRVIMNSASATTITVNTSIFGAQDVVEIQNIGAGVCTVTAGTCTVSSAGSLAIPQHGGGRLVFSSASAATYFPTATTSGVVQVQSASKVDAFTTSSTSFTDITGLSVSITPTLASNKILCLWQVTVGIATDATPLFNLVRGSTAISQANFASNNASGIVRVKDSDDVHAVVGMFLDTPNTTSATTYKIQTRTVSPAIHINRNGGGTTYGGTSSITVMEVTP